MNNTFKTNTREALIKAIQEKVKDAFDRSQGVVPVETGKLKKSGKESELPNGARIFYGMEYASFVERGVPAHYEQVESYYRKSGVFVKAFSRSMPAQPPKEYIKKSIKASFERFSSAFNSSLSGKFKSVVQK